MTRLRLFVVDPPWQCDDQLPDTNLGTARGATGQYKNTMSLAELEAFQLPKPGPMCVMAMWRISTMLFEAGRLMRHWGFRYHSEMVWNKETKNGSEHMGMGRIVRGSHEGVLIGSMGVELITQREGDFEFCMLGVRGSGIVPARRNIRSSFRAPVGKHSAKPDKFYEIMEELFPDAEKFDIFARRRRPGWTCIGNELPPLEGTKP